MTSEPNKPKIYKSELTVKTHFFSFFAIVSYLCCLPAISPAGLLAYHTRLSFCEARAGMTFRDRRGFIGFSVPKIWNLSGQAL